MRDLTQGPIHQHILMTAAPIGIGMLVQTLYFLVDLYFVARIGDSALAGVGAAGIINFIIMALTQMLSVGAVTLISHAVGRKDKAEANLVFNQTIVLSSICAAVTLLAGYGFAAQYMQYFGADEASAKAGTTFLFWLLPGLALQFALAAAGGALRGTGVVKPAMVGQIITVIVNIALAPVLIAGWGTGHAMGIAGAGLATSIASLVGVLIMLFYFTKLEHYVAYCKEQLRPDYSIWKRMLSIGLPAGAEFLFMFLFMAVIYSIIRDFGATSQAGFSLGSRVMQGILLPAMALSFAIAPIAGQNFGAKLPLRVRETFWTAVSLEAALMACLTLICQIEPRWFIQFFTKDEQVIVVGAQYLQLISWNFAPTGIILACSGMFQALGNTWPSLISMVTRVLIFAVPVLWLSHRPGFEISHVWYLSVGTVYIQAIISILLVRDQLSKRLQSMEHP
jgi:putative MATE family efflux protein